MVLKRQQNEQNKGAIAAPAKTQAMTPVAKANTGFLHGNYSTESLKGKWLDAYICESINAWMKHGRAVLRAVDGQDVNEDLIMTIWCAGYARAVRDNGSLLPPNFGHDLEHDEPW